MTARSFTYLILLILIIGGGYKLKQYYSKDDAPSFVTQPLEIGDIQKRVSANGTLNPVKMVTVGTQISGVVKTLNVDFNDHVEEGQILAELDQSLLKTQLEQSKAAFDNAQAILQKTTSDYQRTKSLFDQGFSPKSDLEKVFQDRGVAEAQLEVAKSQIERDQVNLAYSVIRSPVSGVIISRQVDIGQTVAANFQTPTLFQIAQDLKKMQIDTNLSEADVGLVKEDMPVSFSVDAFPGRQYQGHVRQIRLNPINTQNVVSYNVVIDVQNDDLSLLPGMTAFVNFVVAENKNILRVPNMALTFKPSEKSSRKKDKENDTKGDLILDKDNKQVIYLLKDNLPVRVKVVTGISDGKFTQVVSGEAAAGDLVITDENSKKKAKMGGSVGAPGGMRM